MSGTIASLSHHVFFWLKKPDSANDLAQLIRGLNTLASIETVKGFHIATPAATEDRNVIDNSYSVSWLSFFDSEADEQIYQTHPIHLQFVADCESLWSKVVVYDSVRATK